MQLHLLRGLGLLVWLASGTLWVKPLASLGAERSFHLVSEVKGEVWVLRDSRKPWHLGVGADLRSTDKLKLGNGGAVRVRCPNLVRWSPKTVGIFSVEQGCGTTGRMVLKPTNEDRSPTRGTDDPTRPYLISPRETDIIDPQPLLRWNPVAGMKRYQVEISESDVQWKTEVSQPKVQYSGNQAFHPGMRYRVKIKGSHEGSFLNDAVTGFSLLDSTTVKQVNADLAALQREQSSSEAAVLELAHVERSYGLYSAAIDRLSQWTNRGSRSAAVEKLLGDLHWQVALPRLARQRYTIARELMKRDNNRLGEAEVLNQLAEVDRMLGKLKTAIAWLEEAKPIYQEIEDLKQVILIESTLIDLRKRV
jgi:hypothetical protein